MNIQCCKCKRLRVAHRWAPGKPDPDQPTSHTYCPTCLEHAYIEAFSASASAAPEAGARSVNHLIANPAPSV